MEWVTITAATMEDAKAMALDQLGVAAEDAEIEVVEEPKPGLFGRMRGEAVVRARVRPTSTRESTRRDRGGERAERGDRRGGRTRQRPRNGERRRERGPSDRSADDEAPRREDAPKVPVTTVRDAATTFLEGLFAAADLSARVESAIDGDDIEIAVHGDQLTMFVGARGMTLTQLQDITRVVSQRRLGDHDTRLRVDVGGYRQRRKDALGRFAQKVANDVMETGTPRILEPMNSADRKIVHDTLATVEGVVTHSEGDDPFRRVVVSRAPGA
ncbi:MAG: RNA-binding cell elongation regulator Jag/EloR [Ilumatobacteraceae bacterium]